MPQELGAGSPHQKGKLLQKIKNAFKRMHDDGSADSNRGSSMYLSRLLSRLSEETLGLVVWIALILACTLIVVGVAGCADGAWQKQREKCLQETDPQIVKVCLETNNN